MKYILNESPVRTSNNFRINDIKLDLELPTKSNFKEFKVTNLDSNKTIIQYKYGLNVKSNLGIILPDACDATINISESLDKPLILEYDSNDVMLSIKIGTKDNVNADVIIKTKGNKYNMLVINSYTGKNSKLTINYINMNEGNSLVSFNKTSSSNSYTTYNLFDLCGELRIYNYENHDNEPNIKESINNMYITKNEDILDMNYHIKHKGIDSYSSINVLGCTKDKSKKSFKGTIDFVEGSKKSIGRVYENVISLSDDAISSSLPMILCHEEDVIGSHGVSNGKINEEELFYLETRGFSKEEATRYLLYAKFDKYIELINDDNTKEEIKDYINKKGSI
ncbi:MAG: SufD family Fe-S cluster assembly protein [Bacilli bacterium]|nr:SufD family Fe-S cluster assembly protein [Bacilli bacterium]